MKQFILFLLFTIIFTRLNAQNDIYICTDDNELFLIDLSTCGVTQIGNMGLGSNLLMFDIAINPLDSQLYGITEDDLYRIDRFTATTTLVGSLNIGSSIINALTFGDNGILYGAGPDFTGSEVYTINTSTGTATSLGTYALYHTPGNGGYPLKSSGDLTFYQGDLYLSTGYNGSSGQKSNLVKINLTNISNSTNEGEFVSLAKIYGVTTVGCTEKMYASQENNIYELPQSNLLIPTPKCLNIIPNKVTTINSPLCPFGCTVTTPRIINGAASLTESLPKIDLGPDTILTNCTGNSFLLNASLPNATGYLWNDNSLNPTLNATTTGTYWVEVTQGNCYIYDTINVSCPLPITLLNFNAICNNNEVKLEWTTSSEINNDYFIIEKSENGKKFQELSFINGSGNSNTPLNYFIIDKHIASTNSYYRLKQVDYDGKSTYSNIIISSNCNTKNITIYPNPSTNLINIQFNQYDFTHFEKIILINSVGQVIKEININSNITSINLNKYSKGFYQIQLISKDQNVITTKIIKQ